MFDEMMGPELIYLCSHYTIFKTKFQELFLIYLVVNCCYLLLLCPIFNHGEKLGRSRYVRVRAGVCCCVSFSLDVLALHARQNDTRLATYENRSMRTLKPTGTPLPFHPCHSLPARIPFAWAALRGAGGGSR